MKLLFFILFPVFVFSQTITLSDSDIKAFPGAIGHGKVATGARGTGNIYFVTNTNDSGSGSFRQALSDADSNGGGYIIFRTSGVVSFTSNIYIGGSSDGGGNIYVAGQTAPNGGFGIRSGTSTTGQRLWVDGSNIIIRHIRSYGGDNIGNDALTIGDTDASRTTDMDSIVVDHCSFHWAQDENVAFTSTADTWDGPLWELKNVSFTNNIIGEEYDSNYGMIIYGSGKSKLSLIKNLFINHGDRSPLSNGPGNEYEYINNVVHYNGQFGRIKATIQQKANFIGNALSPSVAYDGSTFRFVDCSSDNCPPSGSSDYTGTEVYYDDNKDFTNTNDEADYDTNMQTYLQGAPISVVASDYTPTSAEDAINIVLSNAGAGVGTKQGRDALDQIYIADYNAGTGRLGTQSLSRTPPDLTSGGVSLYDDSDGDGLSDEYEIQNGGSPGDWNVSPHDQPATAELVDGTTIDQSGVTPGLRYTHIDIFLAELAGDWGNETPSGTKTQTAQLILRN